MFDDFNVIDTDEDEESEENVFYFVVKVKYCHIYIYIFLLRSLRRVGVWGALSGTHHTRARVA